MSTWAEVIPVTAIGPDAYEVELDDAWCIGSVPNGGFITSVFLTVSKKHFDTTLSHLNQPHALTLHIEFFRRTSSGIATFKVKTIKTGSRTSTILITLIQTENGKQREEVQGYITHSNLTTESGLSLDTAWSLDPSPLPVNLSTLLSQESDAHWALEHERPFASFRKATQHLLFYLPKCGQPVKSIVDEWVRFAPFKRPGGKWTNESLGFIADMWPQIVETYITEDQPLPREQVDKEARYWYPTVLLNLEVKKVLPAEGVEWLFVRVRAKVIKNGRMDLEVVIMDEGMEIVALSNHVTLIYGVDRNVGGRKKKETSEQSKL